MTDYGHDLVFGTFLTPQNAEPQAPVALAQLSERAGLDLVTFQDHPYQPASLDTWTLMSYVAASTERIRISGNVLNLPLRPPVLLARQAATLDLLSGGRFELGLGAGAFWDAIEAMGAEVASVDDLLPFVRRDGVSVFILASDDPRAIQAWGEEVAPALREAVARERQAAGTPSGQVVRGPKARALRRDGIAYDSLPPALQLTAVEPGDKAYPKVRSTYVRSGAPGLVLRPGTAAEVAEALGFARRQPVPLAIRSRGHGISGRSTNDGGIVIDLARLDGVDVTGTRVRVGAGASWGHLAGSLAPHGLAMSSGDYGDVGVGGLATAGGIGFLVRKFGLTIDHVTAAEVVLADGRLVRADAGENPDLLWALRGAGGNFGIVTAFELDAYPVGDVVFAQMLYEGTDAAALLERWGKLVEAAPRELTSFLYLFAGRRGSPPAAQALTVWAGADTDAAVEALTPLLSVAPVLQQQAQLVPYAAIVAPHDATHYGGQDDPLFSNGFAMHLTPELTEGIAAGLRGGTAPFIAIRAVGGAVNDVDPQATAYPHRHQNFNVSSVGADPERFRGHWDELRPHLDGLYLSFETDQRPERLHDAFGGQTLSRLRELKAVYDPENLFNQNFPIPPLPSNPG